MNIIGISYGYHDSACCLLQHGRLTSAVQEERFSRIKNDKEFPVAAYRYCLQSAGLTIADVHCIAFYEDPRLKLGRQLWMGMLPGVTPDRRASIRSRVLDSDPEEEIRLITGFEGPIEIVNHHLSHAASAYFFSGFDEAAILTVDGVGEWSTTSYNAARGSEITCIGNVDFPNSLGLFYSALTGYLGFEVNEGEYKVMGLASYGRPTYVRQIRDMIEEGPKGEYRLNLAYFSFLSADRMFSDSLTELLGQPPRVPDSEITQFHMDVAASTQFVLEEVLLNKVRYLHDAIPSENLCMAGGVALNVVANSRCLNEGPFKRLFVQPAAGDAGACLGAAAIAHVRRAGSRPCQEQLQHVYLGPSNAMHEIKRILDASSVRYQNYGDDEAGLLECVAGRLADGEVVAWVSGKLEFGPRSLGARSILADPRNPQMQDRINAVVKQRETFRPFAPAVLEKFASDHFALDHPSPFMLEICEVTSRLPLPAITHVDGSARVQTVRRDTHWRFAQLLEEFYRRTGCPILLNTSFNLRGEPIACSTIDALSTFGRSNIDVLVLEDLLINRSDIPAVWQNFSRGPRRPPQEYNIYTML